MTEQQFNHWLTTPDAVRVLLLELSHATGTVYFSNHAFLGGPVSRDNQHRQYEPVLNQAINLSDRLDGELTVGDISVINDGLLNSWLSYRWAGYKVNGFLGDPSWPRDDFKHVLNATNAGLQKACDGEIILGIQDARAQLDKPLTTETINGSGAPLVFGQVFNVTPVVKNRATNTYKASALPLTALDALDRGNAGLEETVNLALGEFTTAATPQGTVTVNMTGHAKTAAAIARQVAALYSLAVDESTLSALPSWILGAYYTDGTRTTGRQVLDDICRSIGGYWRIDHLNRLQLFTLSLPQSQSTLHRLTRDDIERDSLQLKSIQAPFSQISVRYFKNYTPLQINALASPSVIGAALHSELQKIWKTETLTPTLTGYPLADKKQFDTQLVEQAGAAGRAQTISQIRKEQRHVWQLTAFAPGLLLKPGDCVFIQDEDWPSFASGKWVRVLANHRDLTGETCDLEIWY